MAEYIPSTGSLTCCLPGLSYQLKIKGNKHEEVNIPYSGYWCPVRREIQHPTTDYHCLCMYFPDLLLCIHFQSQHECILEQRPLSNCIVAVICLY